MKKASSHNPEKSKIEPVELFRKLSESDSRNRNPKIILKPTRTHVSTKQIDIIDMISNNVVSERVRKDPREQEREEEGIGFETVQELDSEDEGEFYQVMDEKISEDKGIENYLSGKDIIGSGLSRHSIFEHHDFEEVKFDSKLKEFKKAQTMITQPKEKGKINSEVVYEEINDSSPLEISKLNNNENIFDVVDEFTIEEEEKEEGVNVVRQSLIKIHTPKFNIANGGTNKFTFDEVTEKR